MKINPLLKFMSKVKSEDVLHSSGYARAQNEGSFGASGGVSFEKRQEIEQNRKMVSGYDRSMLFNLRRPKVGGGGVVETGNGNGLGDGAVRATGRIAGGRIDNGKVGGETGSRIGSDGANGGATAGRIGGPKQFGGGTGISERFKR